MQGPLGSAVQLKFIEEYIQKSSLPKNVAVLMVHAVNPFGFMNKRLVNYRNVDLDLNFRTKEDAQSFFGDQFIAEGPVLEDIFNPKNPVRGLYTPRALVNGFQKLFFDLLVPLGSFESASNALKRAQYSNPAGLRFGGGPLLNRLQEPEIQYLEDVFREYLPRFNKITTIDIRSGEGPQDGVLLNSPNWEEDRAKNCGKQKKWMKQSNHANRNGSFSHFVESLVEDLNRKNSSQNSIEVNPMVISWGTFDKPLSEARFGEWRRKLRLELLKQNEILVLSDIDRESGEGYWNLVEDETRDFYLSARNEYFKIAENQGYWRGYKGVMGFQSEKIIKFGFFEQFNPSKVRGWHRRVEKAIKVLF